MDISSTTSDISILRKSSTAVTIGDVKTNFRMPDINSIGIGDDSIIHESNGQVTVGIDSVGYQITDKVISFGGNKLQQLISPIV